MQLAPSDAHSLGDIPSCVIGPNGRRQLTYCFLFGRMRANRFLLIMTRSTAPPSSGRRRNPSRSHCCPRGSVQLIGFLSNDETHSDHSTKSAVPTFPSPSAQQCRPRSGSFPSSSSLRLLRSTTGCGHVITCHAIERQNVTSLAVGRRVARFMPGNTESLLIHLFVTDHPNEYPDAGCCGAVALLPRVAETGLTHR